MTDMNFQAHDKILLTGAGFTHNFGAPLASEMWAQIFNNRDVQKRPRVRNLLVDNFDFEDIYQHVLLSTGEEFDDADKNAVRTAVENAYERIDRVVGSWGHSAGQEIDDHGWNELVQWFSPPSNSNQKGFFFTLNQDLFIERQYENHPNKPQVYDLGFNDHTGWLRQIGDAAIGPDQIRSLPSHHELEARKIQLGKRNYFYVKLHGSFHWRDSEGKKLMVIGTGKMGSIQREPLLNWFFELFRAALCQANRRLLIVGYGFRDRHINQVLKDAVMSCGLKIFIVNPVDPADFFRNAIQNCPFFDEIKEGLAGYFPYSFLQLFPSRQPETAALRELHEAFL